MAPLFDTAHRVANLSLKPPKCVLVPTSVQLTDVIAHEIREWLLINIPSWADFNIKSCGKYLGFWLGPCAGAIQWLDPIQKWSSRVKAIAGTHSAASVSSLLYNSRALPVLSFKCQLTNLPKAFFNQERGGILHILHMATNSLDSASIFNLP